MAIRIAETAPPQPNYDLAIYHNLKSEEEFTFNPSGTADLKGIYDGLVPLHDAEPFVLASAAPNRVPVPLPGRPPLRSVPRLSGPQPRGGGGGWIGLLVALASFILPFVIDRFKSSDEPQNAPGGQAPGVGDLPQTTGALAIAQDPRASSAGSESPPCPRDIGFHLARKAVFEFLVDPKGLGPPSRDEQNRTDARMIMWGVGHMVRHPGDLAGAVISSIPRIMVQGPAARELVTRLQGRTRITVPELMRELRAGGLFSEQTALLLSISLVSLLANPGNVRAAMFQLIEVCNNPMLTDRIETLKRRFDSTTEKYRPKYGTRDAEDDRSGGGDCTD